MVTVFCIKAFRPIAMKFGLVDRPSHRKIHVGEIPLVGGISMFTGLTIGFIFILNVYNFSEILPILLSLLIVVAVGMLDDLFDIKVSIRFFFQIIAGFIIVTFADTSLFSLGKIIGNNEVLLNDYAIVFTIFCMIGTINALNFSDGVDGMAGSISLVTFSSIALLALINGKYSLLPVSLIFCAVLIGFLKFNLLPSHNKGKIFMGDSGSMLLGLGISWLLINGSQGDESRVFAPVTALWIFAIPLIDTMSIMLRRIFKGRSPFKPDREHLHHFFQYIGYSDRMSLMIIVLLSLMMAGVGIWAELNGVAEWKMFFSFMIIFLVYSLWITHAWRVTNRS